MKTIKSTSADDTLNLGLTIGKLVKKGISIALQGDLGAGKTTFVQGIAKGLNISDKYYITSPTFNIINEYPTANITLCHLDLYRLGSSDELEYIGFHDLVDEANLIVVEWPGLLQDDGFKFDIEINFNFDQNYDRIIEIHDLSSAGTSLVDALP